MTSIPLRIDDTEAGRQLLRAVRQAAGSHSFDLAIVLGSGWGESLAEVPCVGEFPYHNWSWFPRGQISGHAGQLKILDWVDWRVLVFMGRWHCYQGHSAYAVTAPVRLAAALGVRRIILTCATGGIHPSFNPGDVMLVADHLNLLGDNPLNGLDAPFVDLSSLYRIGFYQELTAIARQHGALLRCGTLAAMPGPSYETPAEIAMLARLGADAVGMSTVPEAIMACALGQEVVSMALIANLAAGLSSGPVSHQDVLACGQRSTAVTRDLLSEIVRLWREFPP